MVDIAGVRFDFLEGKRFSKLMVMEYKGHSRYLCKCDCGTEKLIYGTDMKKGKTKSCGCINKSRELDIVGKKFNSLTIIEKVGKTKEKRYLFKCRCDCGTEKILEGRVVKSGKIMSCGNHNIEKVIEANTTHGLSKERIYKIHSKMKKRCFNPNDKNFKDYGGRGITVCEEWAKEDGFLNFYKWSMQNNYQDILSIDRIDVNGNYEPSNCRWATDKMQQLNKRNTVTHTYNGVSKPLVTWCEELGLNYDSVWKRLYKYDYDFEKAITYKTERVKLKNNS